MVINCYLSPECGAEEGLRKNIALALSLQNTEAQVNFYRVNDDKAVELGLSGSPSIFINEKNYSLNSRLGFPDEYFGISPGDLRMFQP